MAVVVGTAQGKLTLDASKFIANIDSSYKALKSFNDLITDTQKSLDGLSGKSINLDTKGLTGGSVNVPTVNIDPNGSIKGATDNVNKLKDALNVGLTGALKGVGKLAELTFAGFKKYTEFIVNFSKDSLQVGQQFDATMSQVGAIAKADGEDLDALREKAIEMGAQTKFSASEAAQAMVYMGMAAWDTDQIIAGIPGVMALAAASGEDLATTSDIVTDSLTAFRLGAEDANHFADVLAAASTNSNTNVALMGETFKYVAPMAGTLKYSIEDTAIAIGLMANTGIKGSQAGTALRNILTNLAKPTDKLQAAMDALGISLSDEKGKSYNLMEMMQQLRKVFAEVTPYTKEQADAERERADALFASGEISKEEYENMMTRVDLYEGSLEQVQSRIASTISGKYGLSGLLAIVNASDKDFQKLTNSIYAASDGIGSAAEMEEKMMDNLSGSVTIFKSTLETFKITVSDMLKGPANNIVKFGQQSIAKMTTMMKNEGIPGLIKAVAGIIPEGINMLVQYIPQILPSLIDGFWVLINGVIDAVPTALPVLIDSGYTLFFGLADGLTNAIDKIVENLPEYLGIIFTKIEDNIPKMINTATNLFLAIINGITTAIPEIVKEMPKIIKKLVKGLKENFPKIVKAGFDLILALIKGLTDPEVIKSLIEAVGEIIGTITSRFGSVDWWQTADDIFSGLGDGLLNVMEGACAGIDALLGTNFQGWAKDVHQWFDDVRQQAAQWGRDLANTMHKTEIELNKFGEENADALDNFRRMTADLIKEGVDAQTAMATAYQKYITSADAQYYFKERMAKDFVGESGTFSAQLGSQNWTPQQLMDMLVNTKAYTGNTYNFYSPKVLDEKTAAEEMEKANKQAMMGQ